VKAVSGNRSSRRYAKAVFLLAQQKGEENVWSEELKSVDELLSRPEVLQILEHPKLGEGDKWKVVEGLVNGQGLSLRPPALNFLKLLIRNQKIHLLPAIRHDFQELLESKKGVLSIRLVTAIELTPEEKEKTRQKLASSLKKEIRLEEEVHPEILGGAVLQIGDRIVDGSLRTKLQQMRDTLVA
jgi:F-type H+-transporting ATPase subunit delta